MRPITLAIKSVGRILDWLKIPAFLLVVSLGLLSLLSSSSFPWRTSIKPFIVLSGSMRPTITEGSVVFVDRKTQPVDVGDIVTFLRPGNARENVTHRIVSVKEKDGKPLYKTKGDANTAEDLWTIRKEAMWGKVLFSVPLVGYLVSFTKTRLGVLLIVVLPLTIIAIDELRVVVRELQRWKKKKSAKGKQSITSITALFLFISYGFVAVGAQTTIGGFSDVTAATNQQVTTSCWEVPTTPTLLSPADDAATGADDATFTWNSSTSTCPTATLAYNFQLYSDAGLTTIEDESGFGSATSYTYISIPEGEYWWRVQAQDQFGNISESTANHLIVDRTAPSVSLSVTGSWLREVSETVGNGDFETGDASNWTSAGFVSMISSDSFSEPDTTVNPYEGNWMVRIGNPDDPGAYVWENRLLQSFAAGAKSLSVYYNFVSRDNNWDTPGFFMRLNGQEIFRLNDFGSDFVNASSSGWTRFSYDLSAITTPNINLAIYAGNTKDTNTQSWVYVDKISTYFVTAPGHAVYTVSGADAGSGIDHYEYKIDSGPWTAGSTFSVPTAGTHTISYRSIDVAGNAITQTVTLITDTVAPGAVSDLGVSTSENSAILSWTAPGNDSGATSGRPASYDVRYQAMGSAVDCTTFNFDSALAVEKPAAPQQYGSSESLEIFGLNPTTNYCFAIKSSDEAPNASAISNVVFATTLAGSSVNPGDIVINELLWMGTSVSYADEYLELRNMTGRTVSLTGLTLTKVSGGSDVTMAIDLTGKSIGPYGYFLIANANSYTAGDSQLIDTLAPNIWDASLDLSDTELQIKLMQGTTVIDVAWDGTAPAEGLYDTAPGSQRYYSMERISTPSNGANPLEWYTTIDSASIADFFEGTADERGTPGAANRSENEPLARQQTVVRIPENLSEATPAAVPAEVAIEETDIVATNSGTPVEPNIIEEQESSPTATIEEPAPEPSPGPAAEVMPEAAPTPTLEPTTTPPAEFGEAGSSSAGKDPASLDTPETTPMPSPTAEPTPEAAPTGEPTIEPTPTVTTEPQKEEVQS